MERLTMHPTLITHYGHRLKRKKQISRIKAIKTLIITKSVTISIMQTAYFYTSEIKQQAKVFLRNADNINRFNN